MASNVCASPAGRCCLAARFIVWQVFFLLHVVLPLGAQVQVSPRELVDRGNRAVAQGRYYEAIELYSDAQEANPAYFEALFGLARAYYLLEEYDEALEYLERANRFARENVAVFNLRGQLLVSLGRLDDAEQVFQSVLRTEPNNLEARLGLAELELARGRNEAAISVLEETIRLYPENLRALLSLVLIHDYRGQAAVSDRYLEQALRFHRTDPAVHVLAAEHALGLGRIDDARLHAMTALSLSAGNTEALLLLARAELAAERPREALSVAEQLVGIDPTRVDGFYLAGLAYAALGDDDSAVRSMRRALRIDPTNELIRLATEGLVLERYAIDDELRASFASYHYQRGRTLRSANLVSQASVAFRRALLLNPFHVPSRLERADIYRVSGFSARYLQELEVVQTLGEASESVDDAIEVYRSVLDDSVSADWGIDQFEISRDRYAVALFVDAAAAGLALPGFDRAVVDYLRFLLLGYEDIETVGSISAVRGRSEAFAAAREAEADFFAVLSFEAGERSFSLGAEMYLARTGSLLGEFRSFTAGNDRVRDAAFRIARDLEAALPFRATLIERELNRGVISAGRVDGVEVDDVYAILPDRSVLLAPRSFALQYPDDAVVGEFVVTAVDDLVAEGEIRRSGLFDMVNTGDLLVVAPDQEEPDATPSDTVFYPPLYNRVRELRN